MILQLILLTLGFALLIYCAGWLVDGASALARKFNISDLAIGLTIVAFGTSAPELVVNTLAAVNDYQDIVLGNVIGSNLFNLFVILGIAGLIAPLTVHSNTVWKEIPISLFAALLLIGLANNFFNGSDANVSRIDGIILLLLFALFLYYVYKQLKTDQDSKESNQHIMKTSKIAILISFGFAGLIVGGRLVVDNAVSLAETWGLSEKIIGLTIVAAGTSLPELATSVVAVIKKNNDIAVGNIIGSNIFNIFLILGVSSLINPIQYNVVFNLDLYLLTIGTIFLFVAMFMGKIRKLDRWEAAILLLIYVIYAYFFIIKNN
jgi:cation:H+ antiporter